MKKIRLGQIGIGHNHGEGKMLAAQKFPELFEIVGYAEEDEEWVRKRGQNPAYRHLKRMSVQEVLDASDAVLIECDVWNLTKTARLAVNAGKHVHIDKPASGTPEEFGALLDTAKEKGLAVQMGYMYRYNPAIMRCMEKIRSGELGEIYQIDAEMSTYHPAEYRKWLSNFEGGSMYIFGCHLADLIVSILGAPDKIHSWIKHTEFEGVHCDDNCFALMEYGRALARITTLSVEVNGWGMRRFAVMGSKGTVEIKPIEVQCRMTEAFAHMKPPTYNECCQEIDVPDVPGDERYDRMMRDFYDNITDPANHPCDYDHDFIVQKIMDEICRNKA